jgi:predicted RNase H-like nuclease (RuvC/YqgF family)
MNDVSLREFIKEIMDERRLRCGETMKAIKDDLDFRFVSLQNDIERARRDMEPRLSKMNELRSEVTKVRSLFLTRETYDTQHEDLRNRVDRLEEFRGKSLGLVIVVSMVSGIVGAVAISILHPMFTR